MNGNGEEPDLKRSRRVCSHPSLDRLPPHAPECEQAVLGCILLDPNKALQVCAEKIKSLDVFYDLRHQAIYDTMISLYEKREIVDVISIQQRLKDKDILDDCGGLVYLMKLPDAAPTGSAIEYYLNQVLEKSVLRKMIHACTSVVGSIYDGDKLYSELLDWAEQEVLAVRPTLRKEQLSQKALVAEALSRIEKMFEAKGRISGLSTGLIDLDRQTDGLHAGELTVLAAFPSVGKTSLAMHIVLNVLLEQHLSAAVFSLEMSATDLVTRFICSHAKVNLKNLREGFLSERDFPRIASSAGKIALAKVFFDDSSDLTISQVRATARRFVQDGANMIVVDYIQKVISQLQRRDSTRQEEVSSVGSGCKAMARELNVPVLAISSMNPDGTLRESKQIGYDADNLWILESKEENMIDLHIKKQRNGPADFHVNLFFDRQYTRFENASKVDDDSIPPASLPYNE